MIGAFVPWTDRSDSPGWIIEENGCHTWIGSEVGRGYGKVTVDGRQQLIHRVRYEREIGPIPKGMVLDHFICDNGEGGCCNPLHCRPTTRRENTLRGETLAAQNVAKTHCQQGHALAGSNLVPNKKGKRSCRACKVESQRRRRHINRIAA